MSLWFFFSEWFGGASTQWMLFKRSMVNVAWAIGLLFVLMLLQAPAGYAAIVFFGTFVVNGVMFFLYYYQKRR
jgi:hypothetical protein